MSTAISTKPLRNVSFVIFISLMNKLSAVERSASSGQGRNQSIVVQLTSAGNVRNLRLKASPTGLILMTKCKFFLHYATKYPYFSLGVP